MQDAAVLNGSQADAGNSKSFGFALGAGSKVQPASQTGTTADQPIGPRRQVPSCALVFESTTRFGQVNDRSPKDDLGALTTSVTS